MNKVYYSSVFVALLLSQSPKISAQNVAINSSGNPGNAAAVLDLSDASNNNLGLAMPSVDLTNVISASPITSPPAGLIVYNTNTPTITTGGFGAGFYYWSGSQWNYMYNSGSTAGNNILNQTAKQANANFNIQSAAPGDIGGIIEANGTPTTDIFDVDNSGGVPNVYVDKNFQLNAIAGLTASGQVVNLNVNSNFATNINSSTSVGAVAIGNGTTNVTANGNVSVNNNNAVATTNIGTGTTTGNVNIGGASNNVTLPKLTTNSEILYTSGGNGTITATTGGANGDILTYSGGVPVWSGSSATGGGPIGSVLSNSAPNTPTWNATPAANNQILVSNTAGVPTWTGAGTLVGVKVYTTATYTYTPDAGTNAILVKMVGGGGGGGGGIAATAPGGEGGGGGAGAYCELYFSGVSFTANYYTGAVGQGGAGGFNTPTAGSAGTATTFIANLTTYTANGGSGGALGSNASTISNSNLGGAGGAASALSANMMVSIPGSMGAEGLSNSIVGNVSTTGLVVLTLTVIGTVTVTQWGIGTSGAGANSVFGGGGHSVGGNATAGAAALANTGSGGSGGSASYQGAGVSSVGGAGAAGIVIVYEYR